MSVGVGDRRTFSPFVLLVGIAVVGVAVTYAWQNMLGDVHIAPMSGAGDGTGDKIKAAGTGAAESCAANPNFQLSASEDYWMPSDVRLHPAVQQVIESHQAAIANLKKMLESPALCDATVQQHIEMYRDEIRDLRSGGKVIQFPVRPKF